MSAGIVLYAYTFRTRAERVLWTLQELGMDFTVVRSNPFSEEGLNPEYLKLNPDGKVPILVHNGKVLTESLAIMEYLDSLSDAAQLLPAEAEANYEFRRKIHYGLTEIEPYLWLAEQAQGGGMSTFYQWPEGVYQESISQVGKRCKAVSAFLGAGEYLLESGFSMADIYFYHILSWAKQHGIEHDAAMEHYLVRLGQREAFPRQMYWKPWD